MNVENRHFVIEILCIQDLKSQILFVCVLSNYDYHSDFSNNFLLMIGSELKSKASPLTMFGLFSWWKQTFIWALQYRPWYKFISQIQPLCDGLCARGSKSEFFLAHEVHKNHLIKSIIKKITLTSETNFPGMVLWVFSCNYQNT